MGNYDDVYRHLGSKTLSVGSAGGAVVSTGALGSETYVLRLCSPGVVSSTSGIRFNVAGALAGDSVSSTAGVLLPVNWVEYVRCSPGQTVYAISNDGVTTQTLIVTEMTN